MKQINTLPLEEFLATDPPTLTSVAKAMEVKKLWRGKPTQTYTDPKDKSFRQDLQDAQDWIQGSLQRLM